MNKLVYRLLLLLIISAPGATDVSAQADPQALLAQADVTPVRSELSTYIVVLQDQPLASYRGDIVGLAPTIPATPEQTKLQVDSLPSKAYLNYLDAQRAGAIADVETSLGRSLDITYEYRITLNGFATEMTATEAAMTADSPGVLFVERERISYPLTDQGPSWMNADDIWAGLGGMSGTYGEGVIVGIIDTGIDPTNPSFAEVGGDGHVHVNPLGSGTYLGVCDPTNTSPPSGVVAYDSSFPCNEKLIGVWGYTDADTDPRDGDGHGSHTSSTAAGNFVTGSTVAAPTKSYLADISGVAPHANIIMYDGCTDGGGCPGAALNAARDQLVADGVDVVNYSIGSSVPTADPWSDSESLQWLSIRNAGIFVATSAGNSGPGSATISSPADLPWITSVGANSHARAFLNSITLDNGVDPSVTIDGFSMTSGIGPVAVVYAADYPPYGDDARLCADGVFPAGTFSGEIVVCERGSSYGRVDKGQTVLDGGAGGYILAQPDAAGGGPGSVATDAHVLPAVHIDYDGYLALQTYIALTGSANGIISDSIMDLNPAHGDIMASFSSRGPNRSLPDVIVPSVTAPGRAIWAAYQQGPLGDGDYTYNVIQGTSMSSPHVAGAGALMKALHPTWTPAEIQSALMTTSRTTVLNDDGVSPTSATVFDIGSGHVDLSNAGIAGLVLNETTANYQAADPAGGGDPKALNLASLGNAACGSTCSWMRTVKNPTTSTMTWDASYSGAGSVVVTPSHLELAPGQEESFEVIVDTTGVTTDQWHYGSVVWAEDTGDAPDAHLPMAIFVPPADIDVDPDILTSTQPVDTTVEKTLTISNISTTDLVWTIEEDVPLVVLDMSDTAEVVAGIDSVASAFTMALDDDTLEESIGLNGAQFVWFNRFTPNVINFPITLNEVQVMFDGGAGINVGEFVDIYIYEDTDGDGDPGIGATHLASLNNQAVQFNDGVTFSTYSLGVPIALNGPGDVLIAVVNRTAGISVSTFPASMDQSSPSQRRSWVGSYVGDPADPPLLPAPNNWGIIDSFGLPGNWMVRGIGTAEIACDPPNDIPWITNIVPSNGTAPGNSSTNVDVTFDATGLSIGIYKAVLCINSNDTDTPRVVIPITMEVIASAPLIDVAPESLTSTQPPNVTTEKTLTINNVGSADLDWTLFEDNGTLAVQTLAAVDVNANTSGLQTGNRVDVSRSPLLPRTSSINSPLAVLFDQTDSPGTDSFPSQYFIDFSVRARGADDFVIPPIDDGWIIDTVEVLGSYSSDDGPAPDFDVNFYADNAGLPDVLVYNASAVVATVDNSGDVTLDLPVQAVLSSGTYWLSVEANMAFNPGSQQWFWSTRTLLEGNPYAWEDTDGLFGIPACATWQPGASVCNVGGGVDPDSLFRLGGTIIYCQALDDIPWASVVPDDGVMTPGSHTDVEVTVDSTGLAAGSYDATLCIFSTDPLNPLVEVPLELIVDESCTGISPVAPVLNLTADASDVLLNWTDDSANLGGYDIHRSSSPYFTPSLGNKLVPTRPPGTTSYPDENAITGSTLALFYKTNALSCDTSVSEESNQVAVFSYELITGTP